MGKLWMPVKNFKKVSEDKDRATLRHPDGHEVTLAKSILSPQMRDQLAQLPMHQPQQKLAKGGKVCNYCHGGGCRMCHGGRARYAKGGPVRKMDDGGVTLGDQFNGQPEGPNLGVVGVDPGAQPPSMPSQIIQALLHGGSPGGVNVPGLLSSPGAPGGSPDDQAQGQSSPPTNPKIGGGGGGGGGAGAGNSDPYGGIPGIYHGRSAMGLTNQAAGEAMQGARAARDAQQSGYGQMASEAQKGADLMNQNINNFYHGWQAPDGRHVPGYLETIQETDAVKQDILTGHIDPNRYINSGAMPKVLTALGLLGAASGGGPAAGQILGFVQNQMQNDIQAQIVDKSGKINVLMANMHQLGNMHDALQATGAQYQAVLGAMLEKAAANTNSQMAKANYLAAASQIHDNMAKQVYDWKMGQVIGMNPQPGQGGQGGQGGGQGGASSGGVPTDAVGNPLPQGQQLGQPQLFQKFGPVKVPGGGYRFAGPNAEEANKAVIAHNNLDDAIKRFQQESQSASLPKLPFGIETAGRAAKESAHAALQDAIRDVQASGGKLTPMQQQALERLGNISENPWLFGRGKQQQQIKDLGNVNNDTMNEVLGQDIYNYEAPKKPQSNTKWNGG